MVSNSSPPVPQLAAQARLHTSGAMIVPVTREDPRLLEALFATFHKIFTHHHGHEAYLLDYLCAYYAPNGGLVYNHAWLIVRDDKPLGIRFFSYMARRGFGHGAFIGLLPEARGLGLGRWLVERTIAQLELDASAAGNPPPWGYCAEVERIEDARSESDAEVRSRRLAFHRRQGALLLPIAYEEPFFNGSALEPGRAHPMHLMYYPDAVSPPLTPAQIAALIEGVYCDIYQLAADEPLVRRILAALPTVEVSP